MNNPLFHLCAILVMGLGVVSAFLAFRRLFGAYGIPRRVARLRQAGVLPAEGGSDADILRLANENHRYEAALLHVALYGSRLVDAKRVVGCSEHNSVLFSCALTEVACALLFVFERPANIALVVVFGCCAVVFFGQWSAEQRRIGKVREQLARGILLARDAAARP